MITSKNIVFDKTEDVSTIGGDWDNESSQHTASITNPENMSQLGDNEGGGEEGELSPDQLQYFQENAMILDGFKCPNEYLNIITPMEFEEIVNLFQRFDSNGTGTIDKHETKKILHFLGLDFTIEKAEELLKIIDKDNSGDIDFNEFCSFFVMIKRGDERLGKFANIMEKLHSTPLGELERQAKFRELKVAFQIVEVREASLTNPTLYVVELHLSGVWHKVVDGDILGKYEIKKYQGMGNSVREAKYNAANTALVNLGSAMPGIKYEPGVFPEEWLTWIDDNLLRGVEPGRIVSILASKGFHPHRNVRVMHRIIAWHSLLKFIEQHPHIDVNNTDEPFDEEFLEWIRITAQKGIDGMVLFELLNDRYIDLSQHHLLFAQKLQSNELGCVMGKNGKPAFLLDLNHACRCGYVDDVVLYCKCGAAVNDEVVDRHSCERMRPLAYAAMYGHAEVCKVLLSAGALVNNVDVRGRNVIHIAAFHGHKSCLPILIENGGKLFAGDLQGNTPIHLAAIANHLDCVDYLAARGQELTRILSSDKVKPKKDMTFQQLVDVVFEKLPQVKLKSNETVRFEKAWLHDAAIMFCKLMDDDVKYMLPKSCLEIMEDVLTRFDPRPETGIFINSDISYTQHFIKTIPTPAALTTLLKYVFRQACIDSINSWHRTALHLACDANKVNSHEKIIFLLIDKYGCNVNLKDMHGRKGVDLLVQDKIIRDMPTATQAREEIIMDSRGRMLNELYEFFGEEERKKIESRQYEILKSCMAREPLMDERLWSCLRSGSLFKRRYHYTWEKYEDPDTGNYYYAKMPAKLDETAIVYQRNQYTNYTWTIPTEIKHFIDRTDALQYHMKMQSSFLRRYDCWEVFRCHRTQIEYYYNMKTEELRFSTPSMMSWRAILRESTKTGEILGYAREWEVRLDKFQNRFYRNKITRQCEYNQPLDAIQVQPIEMLCTAYQFKNQVIKQKWFSCEQCNRAWKTISAERMMQNAADNASESTPKTGTSNAINRSLLLCEPCVARCHERHKGVRFLYETESSRTLYCMCAEVSKLTGIVCRGVAISAGQLQTQDSARNKRLDDMRHAKRNKQFPPIFACVPRYDRLGRVKAIAGWQICRACIPKKTKKVGTAAKDAEADDQSANTLLIDEQGIDVSSDEANEEDDGDDDSSDESGTEKEGESDDEGTATFSESKTLSTTEDSKATSPKRRQTNKKNMKEESTALVTISKKGLGVKSSDSVSSRQSSVPSEASPEEDLTVTNYYSKYGFGNDQILPIYLANGTWIEVFDAEEPEVLKYSDMVLCSRYSQPLPKLMARIKAMVKPGFYLVRYEERAYGEEVLDRSRLELVSRSKFYFNIYTAEQCWSRELDHLTSTVSFSIPGPDWHALYDQSETRRNFEEYDEMIHPMIDQVYYVNYSLYKAELAAIRLQRIYRNKFFRKMPFIPWKSTAFTIDIPEKVEYLMKEKAGWAYLRRRGKSVGEFVDEEGNEWEEYMDKVTSEYFYWQEEDNLYSWKKPKVFQKKQDPVNRFKEGEEILFRFPGRRTEEVAIVTKVRFDDQTGEDMYDVMHKYNNELIGRWLPRIRIKPVPMEGDALMLAKMEMKWKLIIRRQREADERKRQRDKEMKMQEELKRLEMLNSMAYKLIGDKLLNDEKQDGGGVAISQTTRIMRARMERIRLEELIISEEQDATEGKARREKIQKLVDEVKVSLGRRVTRADVLNITRSIEMKLLMDEKIAKRNELQIELHEKQKETEERNHYIEATLEEKEVLMTTPRSLNRRRVVRRAHMAMKRQTEGLIICEWGCGDWFHVGYEQQDHQLRRCVKRILPCTLGCDVKHTEEYWLATHVDSNDANTVTTGTHTFSSSGSPSSSPSHSPSPPSSPSVQKRKTLKSRQSIRELNTAAGKNPSRKGSVLSRESLNKMLLDENAEKKILGSVTNQQYHETHECAKRLVICPLQCLEWISIELLDQHVKELCTKRPAQPLPCRLGCGQIFGGKIEALIQAENDRLQHEQEECDFRMVRCNWCYEDGKMCAAQMKANERLEHRDYHLNALGIIVHSVPGVYIYKVPKTVQRMKVQLWGGGGGSGYFYGRQGGYGGGGAFIEAILELEPFTVLEITVGSGGKAGAKGTEIETMDFDEMKRIVKETKENEKNLPALERARTLVPQVEVIDSQCGVTFGGSPGGGEGYGGGGCWACGGGGGYTSIARRTTKGTVMLLVAAGGGGGGSISGLPGGALEGVLPGTLVDPICGQTATVEKGGLAGDSGSTYNAAWPATAGTQWQGGNGCEFGAGGGGGYFGGGGGGTIPGIAGGGGGGSSFVFTPVLRDHVVIMGHGSLPGGLQYKPPQACGVGEWDRVEGYAGQGGKGDPFVTFAGNNGAVRLFKPGFY